MGLVQGTRAWPPFDGQEPLHHLLYGAFLDCGGGVQGQGTGPEDVGVGRWERHGHCCQAQGGGEAIDGSPPATVQDPAVCLLGWGQRGGCGQGAPAPPRLLTITGQEHGAVYQVLQSLPEQLAGGEDGVQVEETLQHGQQLGGGWGAAHLGGGTGQQPSPSWGRLTTVGFGLPGMSAPSPLCALQGRCG